MADRHLLLIVEDNDDFYRLLETALADRYRIIRAASAASAREVLTAQADAIDMIVLDMWIPREDGGKPERNVGLEVLLTTKGRPEYPGAAPEIQVVVITGHPDLQNAIESQRLGSYRYIVKGSSSMVDELQRDIDAACAETKGRRIHKAIMEGARLDLLQPLPLRGTAAQDGATGVSDLLESLASAQAPTGALAVAAVLRQIRQLAEEGLRALHPETAEVAISGDS